MSNQTRNKDAGIPGNGGQYAPVVRGESYEFLFEIDRLSAEEVEFIEDFNARMGLDEIDNASTFCSYNEAGFDNDVELIGDAVCEKFMRDHRDDVNVAQFEVTNDGASYDVSIELAGIPFAVSHRYQMQHITDDHNASGERLVLNVSKSLREDLDRLYGDAAKHIQRY